MNTLAQRINIGINLYLEIDSAEEKSTLTPLYSQLLDRAGKLNCKSAFNFTATYVYFNVINI